MRKLLSVILIGILIVTLCACSNSKYNEQRSKWLCTVTAIEESENSDDIIFYCDEEIISKTGDLTLQNKNDFAITVHLINQGKEEVSFDLEPNNGSIIYKQARENEKYTIGISADVPKGTEINLKVYDGEWSEP